MKKVTIENIFAFRGQIMLTEKIKGKDMCRCGLCESPKRNLKDQVWYDARIASDHYDAIKIFVPMSRTMFEKLQKEYKESFNKKERHEQLLKLDQKSKRGKMPAFRLYPLHRSVYDEFANYIYNKYGRPQFNKKGHTIEGVIWGDCKTTEIYTKKYGTWVHKRTNRWVHKRTIGVRIYRTSFEFCVDNVWYILIKVKKAKMLDKNIKLFRKKSGKLV